MCERCVIWEKNKLLRLEEGGRGGRGGREKEEEKERRKNCMTE